MKKNIFISFVLSGVISSAHAAEIKGQIDWPETGRTVRYTVNDQTGQYTYDLTAFKNPSISVDRSVSAKLQCDDLKDFIQGAGSDLPIRAYVVDPVSVQVQLFNLPSDDQLEAQIADDLSRRGVAVKKLENTTTLTAHKLQFHLSWNSDSFSKQAGSQITYATEDGFNRISALPEFRTSLNKNGKGHLQINLKTFLCDLVKERVQIGFEYNATVTTEERIPSKLRAVDLQAVNNGIVSQQSILTAANTSQNSLGATQAEVANAAGLLAFEFANRGYNSSILSGREFLTVMDHIFTTGFTRPTRLNDSEIANLVQSLGTVKYQSNDINLNENKLSIEVR
jgi:hypothetical protein